MVKPCRNCGVVKNSNTLYCNLCNSESLKLKNREKYLKRVAPCVQNQWCQICSVILLHGETFYCDDCRAELLQKQRDERVAILVGEVESKLTIPLP